jgi:hypothetical protein
MSKLNIYCCGCKSDVSATLTTGEEVYPHRKDLHELPFWLCETCQNFVGCHYKTDDSTRPLGVIATPIIKKARQLIHRRFDPLWKTGIYSRKGAYATISELIGYEYHTAEIRTMDQVERVMEAIAKMTALPPTFKSRCSQKSPLFASRFL